jgi:hypothetical protein
MRGNIDKQGTAVEPGRVFREAVEKRSGPGSRIGMTLSGGLDSRAVLAAIPDLPYPLNTLTFGKERCGDGPRPTSGKLIMPSNFFANLKAIPFFMSGPLVFFPVC